MVRLNLRQVKNFHEPLTRLRGLIRRADNLNHLVNIDDGDQQALHQVQPVTALTQPELCAAAHHRQPVINVHMQQTKQPKGLRLAIHQRHIINTERILQRRVLIQGRQHRLRVKPVLHLNHQAHTLLPVRQINHIRDTGQLLRINAVLNLLNNLLRAHHVRQFRHHNALLAGAHLLNRNLRTSLERAAPTLIGVTDTAQTNDRAAAGQIRPRDELHNVFQRGIRVSNQVPGARNHLTQVMRRHIRGHTHRNTRRTVHQQVRESRRQHARLHKLVIVVRHKINHVLIQVSGQCRRRRVHAHLGVTGRRRAVIKRTEVTVPVHQRQAHRKRLRQTHHRVVNRGVTVRVQLTHHLTGHAGALHMPLIRAQPHLLHHVQDAPLHRLQTVPRIRQGTRIDHRVRVLQEAGLHLGRNINIDDVLNNIYRVVLNS